MIFYLKYGDNPVLLASNDWGVILGLPNDATHAFLSRCFSRRVRASLSPPIHIGGNSPSVLNPENIQKLTNSNNLFQLLEH